MKKVFLALVVLTAVLTSCTNRKTECCNTNDTVKAADSMSTDTTSVDTTEVDSTRTDSVTNK